MHAHFVKRLLKREQQPKFTSRIYGSQFWTHNHISAGTTGMDSDLLPTQDSPAPSAALSHFKALPWTAKYLQSSDYKLIPTGPRYLKATGEDAFFSRTINTPTTIPHCLSLCRRDLRDLASPATALSGNQTGSNSGNSSTSPPSVLDCIWLLHLAEPGINGHPKTAHGGVLACILDELTGMCAIMHQPDRSIPLYTATLETTYKAPVFVPSDILCTSWVTRKQGRKFWVRAQIFDKNGAVMTEGQALLIESKTKQKL
jgi:Thioesterase superfamily